MGRVLVMGDIHGAHLALEQCLERSKFDRKTDRLIQLGDVADGWPYVYECVDILLSIPDLINIKGNHDDWFSHWLSYGVHPENWLHGGHSTVMSYIDHADRVVELYADNGAYSTNLTTIDIPDSHVSFFKSQHLYYKDEKKRLFIHGGFNRHFPLSEQMHYVYYWDRDLWLQCMAVEQAPRDSSLVKYFKIKEPVSEIFIGHTSTTNFETDKPMRAYCVNNLDTGAGFKGRLTVMDVDSGEYWQSDPVQELYPGIKGRSL